MTEEKPKEPEAPATEEEVKKELEEQTIKPDETAEEDTKVTKVETPSRGPRRGDRRNEKKAFDADEWTPKSDLGKQVKTGKITNVDTILNSGAKFFEPEIVDALLPNLESDLLLVGQSKGKFGGGSRRVFRQTQKKTKEGNKPSFATYAVVGDRNGHVGVGYGKARETVPAREKALRQAKLNLLKIRRGTGSWADASTESHSIPYKVEGKCGSVIVKIIPAPKGTGLIASSEIAKILSLAGIENAWCRTFGKTTSRLNTIAACANALKQLTEMKVQPRHMDQLAIKE